MVKCADCGYLAVRNVDSRELEEVEEDFREKGTGPVVERHAGNPHLRHEKQPLCLLGAEGLSEDFRAAIENKLPENGRVRGIIQKERPCREFREWRQGSTPKEHREMMDREFLLKREDKRDADQRAWQSEESRSNRKWRFAEFLLAIVALGLIVLAAYIERGGQPTINIITPEPSGVIIEE